MDIMLVPSFSQIRLLITAPNQSSTENKTNLGITPFDGGSVNPNNTEPENKGFYENLPFHGMQNPPNKVTAV